VRSLHVKKMQILEKKAAKQIKLLEQSIRSEYTKKVYLTCLRKCILAPLSGELLKFKILTVAVMKNFLFSFKNIFLFINSELTQWILLCSFLPLLLT
jgi:hypothetical protein